MFIKGRKGEYKGSVSPDLPMVLHAVITGKGKTMLIVLYDTEQPHQFSVAAPAACKNGRDIFNGREYSSANGQFSMEMEARESAFILFE